MLLLATGQWIKIKKISYKETCQMGRSVCNHLMQPNHTSYLSVCQYTLVTVIQPTKSTFSKNWNFTVNTLLKFNYNFGQRVFG